MTIKRRLILIASFPLAIAVMLGVYLAMPDGAGPNWSTFNRVKVGMTMQEVEDVFSFGHGSISNQATDRVELVTSRGQGITLGFTNGRVTDKQWDDGKTLLERLRRWLGI
jgi:hypothetical protein